MMYMPYAMVLDNRKECLVTYRQGCECRGMMFMVRMSVSFTCATDGASNGRFEGYTSYGAKCKSDYRLEISDTYIIVEVPSAASSTILCQHNVRERDEADIEAKRTHVFFGLEGACAT